MISYPEALLPRCLAQRPKDVFVLRSQTNKVSERRRDLDDGKVGDEVSRVRGDEDDDGDPPERQHATARLRFRFEGLACKKSQQFLRECIKERQR